LPDIPPPPLSVDPSFEIFDWPELPELPEIPRYYSVSVRNRTHFDTQMLTAFSVTAPSGCGVQKEDAESRVDGGLVFDGYCASGPNDMIAVTLAPAHPDGLANAVISGAVTTRVHVTNTEHKFARPLRGTLLLTHVTQSPHPVLP
jgi:hypothetical protein